ncbi:358_t:CDS:1, partial [Paraglomus occultum]
ARLLPPFLAPRPPRPYDWFSACPIISTVFEDIKSALEDVELEDCTYVNWFDVILLYADDVVKGWVLFVGITREA